MYSSNYGVKLFLSRIHPIDQILNFDVWSEFQNRGKEHMHAPIHKVDAPEIDENKDSEVVEFINQYIICALPDKTKYPVMSNLVKRAETHYYTTTCRNKKGVSCRFNPPWASSDKTRIVRSEEKIDETILKQSKKSIKEVLSYIITMSDLSDVTLSEILEECELQQSSMTVH